MPCPDQFPAGPSVAARTALAGALLAGLLGGSPARAEEFGGWSFAPPSGADRVQAADHVKFTRITGRTFCQFAVFSARPPRADDVAQEWKSIVEQSFSVQASSPPKSFTSRRGVPVVARSATVLEKKNGNPFAFALYVLQPPGAVGSLLVAATDEATLGKCPVNAVLDSLALVAVPVAPVRTQQPGPATADASIGGAWASASGNPAARSGTGSVSRRQYRFQPDGSYSYFSEVFDGVGTWIHVRESGRYEVAGDRLTIAPTASTISARDWNTVRSSKAQPLEKVTYGFRKHYFPGLREWNLVLTPPAPTERDGPFAVNAQFPNSYLLSNTFQPEWKWP